ncbi:hypothetical protein ACN3E9_11300 [Vibrio pectenicida]|uniref:hypothetical protein n=1 Tax=Vibrio pectenicida TaxID=62763 RepID=UPI003B996015
MKRVTNIKSTVTLSVALAAGIFFCVQSSVVSAACKPDQEWGDKFSELQEKVENLGEEGAHQIKREQFCFKVYDQHAEKALEYEKLQKTIAKYIPVEFERPVIDLRLVFSDGLLPQGEFPPKENTIGILGGIGPLSDASLIKMISTRLSSKGSKYDDEFMIHLYSLPPPREGLSEKTNLTWAARMAGPGALGKEEGFLTHGYKDYYLASNTAHSNISRINALITSLHIGGIIVNPCHPLVYPNIVHLPERLLDGMIKSNRPQSEKENILILGTREAWDKKLYKSLMKEKDISYKRLDSKKEQDDIQQYIDKIKMQDKDTNLEEELHKKVFELAKKYKTKNVLLSCTELPLGLEKYIITNKENGMKSLKKPIGFDNSDNITIYDSEEIFADLIVEKINQDFYYN